MNALIWLAQERQVAFDPREVGYPLLSWNSLWFYVVAVWLLACWGLFRWTLARHAEKMAWRRLRWWTPTLIAGPFAVLGVFPEVLPIPARVALAVLNLPALALVGQDMVLWRWLAGSAASWIVWWLAFYFLEYLAHSRRRIDLRL